jgi:hypothetical protein
MAKPAAKRTYKLDMMSLLESIDKQDKSFWSNLTEEERKGFAPRVVVRWLSTVADSNPYKEYCVLAANDLVNNGLYALGKHPELQYLLMCVAGTGKRQYHQWIGTKSAGSKTPKLDSFLIDIYGECNDSEMSILRNSFSSDDIAEMAKSSGWDDKRVKDLKDEQKKAAKGD